MSKALWIGKALPPVSRIGFVAGSGRPEMDTASGSEVVPARLSPIGYSGDAHLMTISPTRSGKTRSVIVPTLLTYPGPVVVFDPKRELAAVTARRRREMGQHVVQIELFGPGSEILFATKGGDDETRPSTDDQEKVEDASSEPVPVAEEIEDFSISIDSPAEDEPPAERIGSDQSGSADSAPPLEMQCSASSPPAVVQGAFNPLDLFQLPGVDVETESQFLAELLSLNNKGVKDPFWDLNACGLLSGVIAYVATCLPESERNLVSVRKQLMCDDVVYSLAVLLDTVGKKMPRMAYEEIAAFLQMSERDTRPGVLATVQSYLKPFASERVSRQLGSSSFSILDVVSGSPLSIYISLPVDKLRSHAGWLRLVVGVLIRAFTARTEIPEQRTLFVLDEAGQLGNFPFLESLMTLYAGFGVTCWLYFQDLSQLQSCYPASWKTILNNCGVIQTFGIYNRDMARQWGDYFACGVEKLANLRDGDQFVSIRGQGELICSRFDYLRDLEFAGMFDPNPFYAGIARTAPPEQLVSTTKQAKFRSITGTELVQVSAIR